MKTRLFTLICFSFAYAFNFIDDKFDFPSPFAITNDVDDDVSLVHRDTIAPVPEMGIAYTIKTGQNLTYHIEGGLGVVQYGLTLSECSRSNVSLPPLNFYSGGYLNSTMDGGLLLIRNFSLFDDTITIEAPLDPSGVIGEYSFELGYDFSGSYNFRNQELYWIDSDYANSLFVTNEYKNFSQLLEGSPYGAFINYTNPQYNLGNFTLFLRRADEKYSPWHKLNKSYCAASRYALLNQDNADNSITDRVDKQNNPRTRAQFLFSGLNRSTSYELFLGLKSAPGYLGGLLFPSTPFETKTSDSCQLIYDMPMCPEVAFSVPGNASAFSADELKTLYNDMVSAYHANFTRALDQVNCNDTRERMFSVFSSCDNCAMAYRNWLCTVTVPRCADWENNATYLMERPPNTSRNRFIDEKIRPGHYKEILPCNWLCENLCTYCPTSFGFQCPTGRALNMTYGFMSDDGDVTCSYPGAVYTTDSAWALRAIWSPWIALFCISILL